MRNKKSAFDKVVEEGLEEIQKEKQLKWENTAGFKAKHFVNLREALDFCNLEGLEFIQAVGFGLPREGIVGIYYRPYDKED